MTGGDGNAQAYDYHCDAPGRLTATVALAALSLGPIGSCAESSLITAARIVAVRSTRRPALEEA